MPSKGNVVSIPRELVVEFVDRAAKKAGVSEADAQAIREFVADPATEYVARGTWYAPYRDAVCHCPAGGAGFGEDEPVPQPVLRFTYNFDDISRDWLHKTGVAGLPFIIELT
jgi:hypothetical protein